ncbi:MAG: 2-succinyl-5-enolpyruvyl-6-hydroxy-3-cyclohexene-1-carboxylic-acid synthase [Acidimicrobiales bacterium]
MTSGLRPQDVQAAFAAVLVDEWARSGVRDVVLCPGSRSTPLLLALDKAAADGQLRAHVLLDERAAGFFALGLGLATGVPAPVVTTSGTAAAELLPAVLEAHHAGVPLLAVTADRPPELHDVGASQTVSQEDLYGSSLRWSASPGVPDLAFLGAWRSVACRSVAEALGGTARPGPVHLNLAFREPLVGSAGELLSEPELAGRPGGAPWHTRRLPVELDPPEEVVELVAAGGQKGMIVAGLGAGEPEAVWALSQAAGWPVIAELASGCRLPGAIGAADALLRTPLAGRLVPDVVLRLGAPPVSRVLAEWLASLTCTQVLVDRWGTWAAPDRLPREVVVTSPSALCRAVAARLGPTGAQEEPSLWSAAWRSAEAAAQEAVDATLAAEGGLTEPQLARQLVGSLPAGASLVVSASMPVREAEWWSRPRHGLEVFFNRGTNGIDGVLSTAMGVCAARPEGDVTVLLGDLAFLYDAGSLAHAAKAGLDLRVVVVDNDGGGIFSFLPQAAEPTERFERLWGSPHGTDLLAVARAYGAVATEVRDVGELSRQLGVERASGPRVLVVRSERAVNAQVHQRLWGAVRRAVSGADEGRQ